MGRASPAGRCATASTTATRVSYLAYTPDSKHLAVAGYTPERGHPLRRATGNSDRTFFGHEVGINCLAISPDGKPLATCSGTYLYDKMGKIVLDKNNHYVYNDCTIQLWDLDTARELHAIKTHTVPIYHLTYSPDGKTLLSSAYEAQLRKHDVADPVKTETPAFKAAAVYGYAHSVIYSADGKYLLTVGLDYRIQLWDVATGKVLWQWVSTETIANIALASDGRHVAVALQDGGGRYL